MTRSGAQQDRWNRANQLSIRTIAIFVPGLVPGDAFTNVALDLAAGFLNHGMQTVYLIFRKGSGPVKPPPNRTIPIELGSRKASRSFFHLARTLRRIRPDVLIAMPFVISLPAILGWLLSGRIGMLVAGEAATLSYEARVEHRNEVLFRLSPILARVLYPRASGVVAVSNDVLHDLIDRVGVKLERSRTTVIPNPVAVDRIAALSRDDPGHPWLNESSVPTFVYLGRLAKKKNIPLLLEAARFLKEEKIDFRILIIGTGPLFPSLKSLAARLSVHDRVDFVGYRDNPYGLVSRSAALVLPSEEEAFGLVLVEALACGVPVVATDSAGPREIVTTGTGYVVPNHDAKAFASAMARVIRKQPNELSAENCRKRANDFNPHVVALKWLDWLPQLAANV